MLPAGEPPLVNSFVDLEDVIKKYMKIMISDKLNLKLSIEVKKKSLEKK